MAMGTLEETETEVLLMCKGYKGTAGYSMAGVGEPLTPAADASQAISVSGTNAAGVANLPIDPERIARVYGVQVYEYDLPQSLSSYIDRDNQGAFIVINQWLEPTRKRFIVAREFGRYYYSLQRGEYLPDGMDIEDVYANRFAAALLMPAGVVKSKFEKVQDVGVLARVFNVSKEAMRIRLNGLGLVGWLAR